MCQKTHAPLESYEVNRSTIAVLPEEIDGKMGSKVIEKVVYLLLVLLRKPGDSMCKLQRIHVTATKK